MPSPRNRINGVDEARAALATGNAALLWSRCIADTETPISAALKLFEDGRGDWILESVEGGETRGRYSMIGLAPDLVFRAHGTRCAINSRWTTDQSAFIDCAGETMAELRGLVQRCRVDQMPVGLPPALGCLVGYFAYETYALIEKLDRPAENPIGMPDMVFVRPTVILVFDRLADELTLVAPLWPGDAIDAAAVNLAIVGAMDRGRNGSAATSTA